MFLTSLLTIPTSRSLNRIRHQHKWSSAKVRKEVHQRKISSSPLGTSLGIISKTRGWGATRPSAHFSAEPVPTSRHTKNFSASQNWKISLQGCSDTDSCKGPCNSLERTPRRSRSTCPCSENSKSLSAGRGCKVFTEYDISRKTYRWVYCYAWYFRHNLTNSQINLILL